MRSVKLATVSFAAALVVVIVLSDLGYGPRLFGFVNSIPGGDHTGHFFLMGMLSFLVNLSLSCARFRVAGLGILKGTAIVFAIVTLEELSQLLFPARRFSYTDLLFSYAGVLVFGWLAAGLFSRSRSELAPSA